MSKTMPEFELRLCLASFWKAQELRWQNLFGTWVLQKPEESPEMLIESYEPEYP